MRRFDNAIRRSRRLEWIAHRDVTPLRAMGPDCLSQLAREAAE